MRPNKGDSNPAPSASLEDSSISRSFFSRLTLPIRQRSRNISDFHIRPADPHRKYSAGDNVRGAVILTVIKPIRITHLTVSLYGYARAYRGTNPTAAELVVNPGEIASEGGRLTYHGNGFASLFQDEQVLSADGRLGVGRYEFNFDLLFPAEGLPSSIDFERGTISYMITATLTRPTPISPTTRCERKIDLVETIDVGPLAPPRAHTISLEPLTKRSRKKRQTVLDKAPAHASDSAEPASDLDSTRANENSTEGSTSVNGDHPGQDTASHPMSPAPSDVRSEISGDSGVSGSTGLSRGGTDHSHSRNSYGANRLSTAEDRTITATIATLKGGCLPGDLVPIHISVQHIKRIKSMHGVIVTLYRLARIDPLSAGTAKDAGGRDRDDYLPKSRTGLGGLSLSANGRCTFRKDLSQSFRPLIIDPVTLTASVKTNVRVPEDVFPTITGVPGEIIRFTYHLEVIVDLGGKLASQIQSGQSRVGTLKSSATAPLTASPGEGNATSLASWNGSLIDTDRLRREKGVVSAVYELVVGTTDSHRQRGRGLSQPSTTSAYAQQVLEPSPHRGAAARAENGGQARSEDGLRLQERDTSQEEPPSSLEVLGRDDSYLNPPEPAAPFYIPPPEVPDQAVLTEKERIRQAEQRLLPSRPTVEPADGGFNAFFLDAEDIRDDGEPEAGPSRQPTAPEGPTAPTLEELGPGAEPASTDDKQELERQRLLVEASAPPEFPEDCESPGPVTGPSLSAPEAAPPETAEPSAPVLDDDEGYRPQQSYGNVVGSISHGPSEPLPRYER